MFGSDFNDKQLQALTILFKEEEVFQPAPDKIGVAALFLCKLPRPIMVKDIRRLCYIMDQLSKQGYISSMWQAIADKNRCFISLRGNLISRNMLSSAKYRAVNEDDGLLYYHYDEYIRKLHDL